MPEEKKIFLNSVKLLCDLENARHQKNPDKASVQPLNNIAKPNRFFSLLADRSGSRPCLKKNAIA